MATFDSLGVSQSVGNHDVPGGWRSGCSPGTAGPDPEQPNRSQIRRAILLAPLVGLLLGLFGARGPVRGRILFAHALTGQLPTDTLGSPWPLPWRWQPWKW